MPYGIFKTGPDENPYCVFRVDVDGLRLKDRDTLGCHPSEEKAQAQIQAIEAASRSRSVDAASLLKAVVAANVGGVLESRVHEAFTLLADKLYGYGILSREERISLSKAIGESLQSLSDTIDSLDLTTRVVAPEVTDDLMTIPTKRVGEAWITVEEMESLCPSCAENMRSLNLEKVNLYALKQMPPQLLKGLCDHFGEDEGFFTRCVASSFGGAGFPGTRENFCAWLHDQCHEKWPAEKALSLVASGGGLKALGDGWVGGELVVFSPDGTPKDITGDYFDKQTNFYWDGRESRPAMYHHGLDPTLGKRHLGTGWQLDGIDDVALWVKTQLNLRDKYEKMIYVLTQAGKMGLSSGTAEHMIRKASDGRIIDWFIVEGSFTPTPTEPRTRVFPLRSIQPIPLKSLVDLKTLRNSNSIRETPKERGSRIDRSRRSRSTLAFNQLVSMFRQLRFQEAKAMSIEELLATLQELVPDLTEEQLAQLGSILRLSVGEAPVGAPPVGGEVTEEMRAHFGLSTWIDPLKAAATLEEVLSTIQSVISLSDEQLEKVTAILQLALAKIASEVGEVFPEEEFEGSLEEEVPMESEIRSIVSDAVNSVLGTSRPQASVRPPYRFTPRSTEPEGQSPGSAASLLRFGETSLAVKAIATDLYGADYELKRFKQIQAFGQYVRHGVKALDAESHKALKTVILTPSQLKTFSLGGVSVQALKTDMSDVVDQLGGFLIPEDFRMDMIERLPGLTVVRRYADVYSTGSDMMTRVKVTGGDARYSSAVRVSWVGDVPAAASSDTRPTFGVERTPIHIAKATIHIPMALLEDTPFPLVAKINEWASQAYAVDEDEQFLVGTGIAKPEGILPNNSNLNTRLTEANSGSNSDVTFDGLKDLRYSIRRQYRTGSVWIMNDTTARNVSKLKDGEGRYLWQQTNREGEPDRLMGYPVETSEAMPDIAQNAYPIIFGNLKEGYQVADRIGMSVVRDDVTQAEEDLVKFIFRRRLGGQLKSEWALSVQKITV